MEELVNRHRDIAITFRAVSLRGLAAIFWEALHHGVRSRSLDFAVRGEMTHVSQHFVRTCVTEMLRAHGVSAVENGRQRADYTEEMRRWCEATVKPVYFPGAD